LISDYDLLNKDSEKKVRTKPSIRNGLFPIWFKNTICAKFEITNAECAFLSFSVFESDVIGSSVLLAQANFPVSCLRPG
jgi:hypothetical protein